LSLASASALPSSVSATATNAASTTSGTISGLLSSSGSSSGISGSSGSGGGGKSLAQRLESLSVRDFARAHACVCAALRSWLFRLALVAFAECSHCQCQCHYHCHWQCRRVVGVVGVVVTNGGDQ
jgi:hypothetical protein